MSVMDNVIVTGGAGFIGANFVRLALARTRARIIVVDKLTYAGNLQSLAEVSSDPRFHFVHADIADADAMDGLYRAHPPRWVVNFAAESHVDRSIDAPRDFVRTNVVGAFELLEAARTHLARAGDAERARFRFLHVSTDEVYGSLGDSGLFSRRPTTRVRRIRPRAGADHLVRATTARSVSPRSSPTVPTTTGPISSRRN